MYKTAGISVSNYSSLNPDSKCSIYARVAVDDEVNASKTIFGGLSSITAVQSSASGEMSPLTVAVQEGCLTVSSQNVIQSVAIYGLFGSILCRSNVGGKAVKVQLPASFSSTQSVYVVCAETDGGVVSRKLIMR